MVTLLEMKLGNRLSEVLEISVVFINYKLAIRGKKNIEAASK